MDLYYQLTYWLFLPQVWVIMSLIFIGLEVTDGSAIFFLPMGISAALIASLIFLVDNSVLPLHFFANYLVLAFSVLGGCICHVFAGVGHREKTKERG